MIILCMKTNQKNFAFQTQMALLLSELGINMSTRLGSSFPNQGKHFYLMG